jgi:hypothetical protein
MMPATFAQAAARTSDQHHQRAGETKHDIPIPARA